MRGPYMLDMENRQAAREIFRVIGADQGGIDVMLDKAGIYPFFLKEVKSPAANILKQQMLSLGGEAVIGRWALNNSKEFTDVLLLGTIKHYHALTQKLTGQPWGLENLRSRLEGLLGGLMKREKVCWKWVDREITLGGKPLVMGILNITPDSFSDGGCYLEPGAALRQAQKMVEEGADIIDVGGESTRPGALPVSVDEELHRVMPVLEGLLKEIPVPISLDTYKARTAFEALKFGVHIINDVGGAQKDAEIAMVVADFAAPVIIMHNKKCSADTSHELVAGITDDLADSVELYRQAGLPLEKMAIDPGIGFGKDPRGNLAVLKNLASFQTLNLPVLVGASRKSFIGAVLGTTPQDRLEGSLAAAFWAAQKGAAILRVHDVKETVRMLKVLEAIRNAGGQE